MRIGTKGTIWRGGIRYAVEIKRVDGDQYLCESFMGLYFFGWVAAQEFTKI